jgi:hypothetical protein
MNLLELQRENEALKNDARKLKFVKVIDLIQENVELKEENETLKLRLFWKEHNPEELNAAMHLANTAVGGPGCSCLACAVSGRHVSDSGQVAEKKPCTFKPWFEQVLREHDMSIGHGLPDVPVWVDGGVVNSYNDVLDDGQHFSNLASQDWFCWTYGSKLWKATSVDDPELAKLHRLLYYLDTLGE